MFKLPALVIKPSKTKDGTPASRQLKKHKKKHRAKAFQRKPRFLPKIIIPNKSGAFANLQDMQDTPPSKAKCNFSQYKALIFNLPPLSRGLSALNQSKKKKDDEVSLNSEETTENSINSFSPTTP
jgi:hypothetical protein